MPTADHTHQAVLDEICATRKAPRHRPPLHPPIRVIPTPERTHNGIKLAGNVNRPYQTPVCILLSLQSSKRRRNVGDGTNQNERIIPGWEKSSSLPEGRCFHIDSVDEQRPTANELCHRDATLQSMFQQAGPDTAAGPGEVRCELAEQEARHWIRRLARSDGPRQGVRDDGRRRETIEADHAAFLVSDQNRGEALLLVRKRPGLEPVVERRLTAGECRDVVRCGERLGDRETQGSAFCDVARLPRGGALRQFDHFGNSGCGR